VEGREPHLQARERRPLFKLLRERNVWGLALPRFLADPTWGTLTFWLPLYLTTTRGFDLKQIAMFAWLPFVAADIGCMVGPAIAAWLQRRGMGLINARRCAFTVGAVLMISMIFVPQVQSPYAAIALLCLGGFAHQVLSITCITLATDLFPQNEVGTVSGFAGTFANLGVLLFSLAMGGLVATVGYDPFFIALGLLDLVAAAVLWTVVRPPLPAEKLS
jgi:ACS family hexuronate transporter-like MFS transporter